MLCINLFYRKWYLMKREKDSYRLLIEHLPDAFAYHQIILDDPAIPVDYIFLEINKAFEELTGLKRQEVIGKKVTEILPGIEKAEFDWIGTYGKVALSGEQIRFESFFETLGRWYDVSAYSDKAGYFAVAFRDISKGKETEQALLREKREKELIINNLAEQVTFLDLGMNIIWTNSKAIADRHSSSNNYLGEKCYKAYHKLSEPCPGCPIIDVFKSGVARRGVYRSPDGSYWQMTGVPVYDDNGKMVGVLDTALDVSDLKSAELENIKLQSDLEQRVVERTTQLEASNRELDAFAYSVSHDLRAPLRAMGGFSEILQSDYSAKLDDQGKHYLDRIQKASNRMGELIDDLLILSRVTRVDLQYEQVNISKMAAEIIAELQGLEPERLVSVEITAGMTARGDKNLLHLALENLLGNAWKFSSGNNQARIEVGCAIEENNTFYIADNGAGFDMTYADKLYVPFQRLHGTGEFPGTGIGLSIVYRIITRHGGKLWAEGEVGSGASFFFTLP